MNRSPLLAYGARPLRLTHLTIVKVTPRYGAVDGMGFQYRARVRGEARVDAGLRARRDLPARDPRARSADVRATHYTVEGRGEAPRPLGSASRTRARRRRLRSSE